jgi:hypothetical protein
MITKINRKKLMDVLTHFQKIHAFANIVVLSRESGCTFKGVSEVLLELRRDDRVQVIKIVSYHPQTGVLGEETCYRLGQPAKPRH